MKLVLRPWEPDDAPALGRAVAESIEHLRPWMPWVAFEPQDVRARREWIRQITRQRAAGGDRVYGMWLGDDVVGGCGLHDRLGAGALEVGYWVHADFTRRGLATEAVRQLCEEAFALPGIDHVEIHHDRANAASGAVAAAAGFSFVSEHPHAPDAPANEGIERVWRLDRPAAVA